MDYSKYSNYRLKDFLEDDFFIQWVINPDEAGNSFWQGLQENYPEKAGIIDKASSLVRTYRMQEYVDNKEKKDLVWQRIENTIQDSEAGQTRKIFRLPVFVKVAAAVLLVVASAVWVLNMYETHAPRIAVLTTGFGEIKNIRLPDQTLVTLNANSTLSYNERPSAGSPREVWIQGEAYFSVNHINKDSTNIAPGERFIVHCGDINIEVLGTTFNVKSRHGKTDVALITGKIRIDYSDETKNKSTLIMAPGDYVQYAAKKILVNKKLAKPAQLTSWAANEISFTDASLEEITEMLEDRFGYKVNTKDTSLLNLKIEGDITVNDVAELLDVVTTTLNVRIEQSANKHITISK